jgi:predicted pyridoxine 5'-phosphate oxidase superfamily flavin-nucleotide-binding protein
MPEIEPTAQLNDGYSQPGAAAPPWAAVTQVLSACEMFWLSTVRRDGRPHVTPLPAIWADGSVSFCVGSQEQKARNLESNQNCVIAAGANQFRSGLDVVIEGTAARVTGQGDLLRLATLWKSKLDWDFTVIEGGFRDPAGRVGLVFGVTPAKVLAFGKSPFSQTRYLFTA